MTSTTYLIVVIICGLAVLLAYQWLAARTPVDRDEDGAQSEADAQELIEASRPAPLEPPERPHVRAGGARR